MDIVTGMFINILGIFKFSLTSKLTQVFSVFVKQIAINKNVSLLAELLKKIQSAVISLATKTLQLKSVSKRDLPQKKLMKYLHK